MPAEARKSIAESRKIWDGYANDGEDMAKGIKSALREVKDIESGKIKPKTFDEFLGEL
jgi:hypothetical protein